MNKKLFSFLAAATLLTSGYAQFTFADLEFFVGTGSDTAMLIVDFKDGDLYNTDSSYAWGVLFNDSTTGENILNNIAAADINFSVNIANGFLNDVVYGSHSGLGGMPDYWSTWSGTDSASLGMNMGIGTKVYPNEWFAISYTNFNPAVKPGYPIPAFNPSAFTISDVKTWIGTGSDSAVLVVDFLNGGNSSYAWGYLFNDSTTGENLLNDIAAYDTNLSVNAAGGFLNDIIYQNQSGLAGAPNYWGTWSATNLGNWYMNNGISQTLKNGDFFGASYTDWSPALRPNTPQAVEFGLSSKEHNYISFSIYPNPAQDFIMIESSVENQQRVKIYTNAGELVLNAKVSNNEAISIKHLPKGVYWIMVSDSTQALIID